MASTPRSSEIQAPAGLYKAEKIEFFRVIGLRKALERPVMPGEVDLVVDYAVTRIRLGRLRRLARKLDREQYPMADLLAVDRQISSVIAASRRLARDLGIVG